MESSSTLSVKSQSPHFDYCDSFIVTAKPIQSVLSAYCGHCTVYYCLIKTLNYCMSDIDNAFIIDITLNDYLIHRFVCDGL